MNRKRLGDLTEDDLADLYDEINYLSRRLAAAEAEAEALDECLWNTINLMGER